MRRLIGVYPIGFLVIGIFLLLSIPCQISVDVYDGPLGKGWTVTLRATKAGVLYWRTWNVGAEMWRRTDWMSQPVGSVP